MDNYQAIGYFVVAGIALIGFVKPMVDLKAVLVRLEITLKNLETTMGANYTDNRKDHDVIFSELRRHGDRLLTLETEHEHNHWEE